MPLALAMAAANNTSKSGSKSCGSPDEYYEDEIVTWLQYPLGDSLEKGYCSELFGQWSSSSTTVKPPIAVGASKMPAVSPMGAGTCTYLENGSFSRSDCATVPGDSDVKERVGSTSVGARATCAEGALALGAERAAGLVSQTGRDEFSKVRTSMQPPAGSQLTPLSTPHVTGVVDQLFRSRTVAMPGSLMAKLPQGLHSPSKPPHSLPSYGASVSSGLASAGKGTMSNSLSFTSYRSRNPAETPIQMPSAQESGCSRVTEEATVRRASDYSSSASSRGQAGTGQATGVMPARFTPLAMEVHNERTTAFGMSEMVIAASSGRSLSGTTLSTREASSNSGKRKLDDSESQSEDVEGESSVDVKQPRKSSSKRNRAAEVHNLSERNRRNRINEKLKALQDLIPNSSKTDKASVLDEAIEYMKTLQMQLQMVSMRSGLSVSPMMIPLGMPHLQMAPLHPVGLGVPVGHPGLGMGMGLHMSMGMGMLDLPQGMPARPPQPISASPNHHFSIPYQVRTTTGSQECTLDSTNMGSIPSQFMPLPHGSSQMHPSLNSLSSMHSGQHQEHWQHAEQPSEAREPFNEQVGKQG